MRKIGERVFRLPLYPKLFRFIYNYCLSFHFFNLSVIVSNDGHFQRTAKVSGHVVGVKIRPQMLTILLLALSITLSKFGDGNVLFFAFFFRSRMS